MTEFTSLTQRQQKAWSLGDLGKLAAHTPPLYAESLCESLDLHPEERVLDVAAGTGTTSIAAARRFCQVIATDFVLDSLVQGRRLAAAEGLSLEVRAADAQSLPFEDGEFDAAMSTFGVMFAPDQQKAATELERVVRPGGRIGITAWCPDGVVGKYAATIGTYIASPGGLRSPFEWGTPERIRELFAERSTSIQTVRKTQPFRYPTVQYAVEFFREWYGPTQGAFAQLDEQQRAALHDDMSAVWSASNQATNGTLVAHADYLETIVVMS
ncbi:class I SAM-dependent methyltransferase [Nocardia sp. NPDC004278]